MDFINIEKTIQSSKVNYIGYENCKEFFIFRKINDNVAKESFYSYGCGVLSNDNEIGLALYDTKKLFDNEVHLALYEDYMEKSLFNYFERDTSISDNIPIYKLSIIIGNVKNPDILLDTLEGIIFNPLLKENLRETYSPKQIQTPKK